jgi:hypothetical protein
MALRLINAEDNQSDAAENDRKKSHRPGCLAAFLREHTMPNVPDQ